MSYNAKTKEKTLNHISIHYKRLDITTEVLQTRKQYQKLNGFIKYIIYITALIQGTLRKLRRKLLPSRNATLINYEKKNQILY